MNRALGMVTGAVGLLMIAAGCSDDTTGPSDTAPAIGNILHMAFAGGSKAYVTQFDGSSLVVVDITDGSVSGTIDLGAYVAYSGTDSAQSSPYMSAVEIDGGIAYVACQRLRTAQSQWGTTYVPADTSKIVMVNTSNDSILGAIALVRKNPSSMSIYGRRLYVSCSGSWMDPADGAIEAIDLDTREHIGVIANEQDFGGTISDLIVASAQKGYVAVGKSGVDYSYWTELVPFNLSTGVVGTAVSGIADAFGGLARDSAYVYAGDRGAQGAGVVVIDIATDSVIAGPISTGLPPSSLVLNSDTLVATTIAYDYSAASMASMPLTTRTVSADLISVHSDNRVFSYDGDTYLLERMGRDVLTKFDGAVPGAFSLVYQKKLGNQ